MVVGGLVKEERSPVKDECETSSASLLMASVTIYTRDEMR